MSQLKPCPFCGHAKAPVITSASEMHDEEEDGPYMHSETWAVICDASRPDGPGGCGASGGFKLSVAEATAAWNTRAAPLASGEPAATNTKDKQP